MTTLEQKSSRIPAVLLTLILLLLAFRLTSTEVLRETMSQKASRLDAELHPSPDVFVPPDVGAPYFVGYATALLLIAGVATFFGQRARALTRWRMGQLVLILLTAACLIYSTWRAAGRFPALLGTADLVTALLAGWTIAHLCHDDLLGNRGRHAVIAAIIAVLAIGCAKALMQHFSEFPETLQEYQKDPEQWLRRAGISNEPVQRFLFEQRIRSAEVYGFGAMANVFAAQLIPLATLLFALVTAGIYRFAAARAAVDDDAPQSLGKGKGAHQRSQSSKPTAQQREIPLPLVALVGLGLVLLVTLCIFPLTDSKGAIAAGGLALLIASAGALLWKRLLAWRRPLLAAAGICVIAAAGIVIGYGRTHHGLPTKSMLFRWQYWTGGMPMVEHSPLTGVGLNNFGDYYLQFKAPSSPEDVKDPHNFFVRLLSEAGVPATVLVTALLLWLLFGATRSAKSEAPPRASNGITPPLIAAGVAAFLWIPMHIAVESSDAFTVSMTMIYAIFAWAVFAAVVLLLEEISTTPVQGTRHALLNTRFFCLCAVVGALGMLLYDQVNMALVTGPVAMLFWVLLGLGDSYAAQNTTQPAATPAMKGGALTLAGILALAGVTSLFAIFIPVTAGTFPWDPAPRERAYLRAYAEGKFPDALTQLDQAIARAPNSVELLMQRIGLKRQLGLPMAEDIRRVLSLDRANANVRVNVASQPTDLPVSERIAALEDALRFNAALPDDEPKRLPAAQLIQATQILAELKKASGE